MIITNRYAEHMTRRHLVPFAATAALAALVLAGCAPAASQTTENDDAAVHVVTSTNVYASIVEAIGGDRVEVTPLIDSLSQDPHSYESSARDQLTISRADLIVANGGGYDSFVDGLVESTGTDAEVLRAVEFSHDFHGDEHGDDHGDEHADEHATAEGEDDHAHSEDDGHGHIEGFNEHVWYDPHTIAHLAEDIAAHLTELDPEGAAAYEAGGADFAEGVSSLEGRLSEIDAAHAGEKAFATEPVPVYLTTAAGLVDAAPAEFSEAVEEGQDVPPATLLDARRILEAGDVRVVIANAQTGGAETTEVIGWAEAAGIPVLEFTELVPEGLTYLTWMDENVTAIADALDG